MKRGWILLGAMIGTQGLAAAPREIQVMALMPGMAVMRIDGTQRTLKAGATSPEGVKLVSADSATATIEIDGQEQQLKLGGGSIGSTAGNTPKSAEVRLYADPSGMFRTPGTINGQPVDFMVDTGATTVAMSADLATRLGIDYRLTGHPTMIQTASKIDKAWSLTLDRVKVGEVEAHNVQAVVMQGSYPSQPLLGMSFLGQLEMVHQDRSLVLRRK